MITFIQRAKGIGRSLTAALLFVALGTIAGRASGNGVSVSYTVLTSESHRSVLTGTIRVHVRNSSSTELRNVDLRLADPGPSWIEKGLFQFGTIPAGESRVVSGRFAFDTSGPPVVWKVDYDDPSGGHHVTAQPAN